jgi:hypothetical protein
MSKICQILWITNLKRIILIITLKIKKKTNHLIWGIHNSNKIVILIKVLILKKNQKEKKLTIEFQIKLW